MCDIIQNMVCLACGSDNLLSALDLGEQPLANSYPYTPTQQENRYPLAVNLCNNCYHLQLTHTVNPSILFKDYIYVSGTSTTLKAYSDWFAAYVDETISKKHNRILDIGCNDGSQLDSFKDFGYDTWGVDPAENIYPLSSKNHSIVCDFFGSSSLNKLNVGFDAICGQNVLGHNYNPLAFLETCKQLMDDKTFLFIQTSQADMVLNNEFDTIYHEHISYFNINSMNCLANRAGLNLIDAIKVPIHGNSYVFVFSKTVKKKYNIINKIAMEKPLTQLATYQVWEMNVKTNMQNLKNTVDSYHNQGYAIVGYGAAAKGNTLLNYIDLKMDVILDDNQLKHNRYTPGTMIPIRPPEFLNNYTINSKILFVPLAWNFFDEISARIKKIRNQPHDVFLKYFPTVEIIDV